MSKHKVKIHNWFGGKLKKLELEFENYEEALRYTKKSKHRNIKITDEHDRVIYSSDGIVDDNSYA